MLPPPPRALQNRPRSLKAALADDANPRRPLGNVVLARTGCPRGGGVSADTAQKRVSTRVSKGAGGKAIAKIWGSQAAFSVFFMVRRNYRKFPRFPNFEFLEILGKRIAQSRKVAMEQ